MPRLKMRKWEDRSGEERRLEGKKIRRSEGRRIAEKEGGKIRRSEDSG